MGGVSDLTIYMVIANMSRASVPRRHPRKTLVPRLKQSETDRPSFFQTKTSRFLWHLSRWRLEI